MLNILQDKVNSLVLPAAMNLPENIYLHLDLRYELF